MATRPRGRPEKATPEIRQLISEIYVRLSQKGERPYVDDVYQELGVKLAKRKMPLAIAKSTVRRIMQELKDEAARTQNEERELDNPWSIGASLAYGIPSHITPTLMEIRRWCILTGQSISVREARWVAYLQRTSDTEPSRFDTGIANLYGLACRYALREKASKLLGKAMIDTSDLDIHRIQWDSWVRQVAQQTGALPAREANGANPFSAYVDVDNVVEEKLLIYLDELKKQGQSPEPTAHPWPLNRLTSPELEVDFILGIHQPPAVPDRVSLDSYGQEVYALSILYLAKGPMWNHLAKQERDRMAEKLKAEIRIHELTVEKARGPRREDGTLSIDARLLPGPRFEDWKIPADYLRSVGYEEEAN